MHSSHLHMMKHPFYEINFSHVEVHMKDGKQLTPSMKITLFHNRSFEWVAQAHHPSLVDFSTEVSRQWELGISRDLTPCVGVSHRRWDVWVLRWSRLRPGRKRLHGVRRHGVRLHGVLWSCHWGAAGVPELEDWNTIPLPLPTSLLPAADTTSPKIGRASCRERV